MAYDESLATRIRAALAGVRGVTERKMFGGLAFLVNGRMACGIVGSELMVRVPKDEHAAALRRAHVRPMDFTGRPMVGFLYVALAGLKTRTALEAWVARGAQVAIGAAVTMSAAGARSAKIRGGPQKAAVKRVAARGRRS